MAKKKSANIKQTSKRATRKKKKKKKKPTIHCITGKIHLKNPKSKLRPTKDVRGPFRLVDNSLLAVDPSGKAVPLDLELYEFTSIKGLSLSRWLPRGQVVQFIETTIKMMCQRVLEQHKHDDHINALANLALKLCEDVKQEVNDNDAIGAASAALRLGSTFQWLGVYESASAAMAGHKSSQGGKKAHRINYPNIAEEQQGLAKEWKKVKAIKKDKNGKSISNHAADKAVAKDLFGDERRYYKRVERARKKYPDIKLDTNS